MSDLTRDAAAAFSPAALANALLTLALIPNSYSPASITILLQEAAGRIYPGPSDPSPSDVAYDDMTRAWRNGDDPLARSLADALLQYMANDGQPLTGDRDVYYARQIHADYLAPGDPLASDAIDRAIAEDARRERDEINRDLTAIRAITSDRPELPGEQHVGDSDPPEPEEEEE